MSDESKSEESANQPRLTNKQRVFVAEYLRDFNATQAAIRAGYSARTAFSIGPENLKKPLVAQAIQKEISERAMKADEVLLRLAQHARGDLADFVDITSVSFALDLQGAKDKGITHLIKKFRQRTTTYLSKSDSTEDREITETEIELHDPQAALIHLGRHLKLFSDKLDVDVKGSINHTFEEMLRRTYADDDGGH